MPAESGNVVFKLEMVDFGSFGLQFGEFRIPGPGQWLKPN